MPSWVKRRKPEWSMLGKVLPLFLISCCTWGQIAEPVDINSRNVDDLLQFPFVTDADIACIVNYKKENGNFHHPEELYYVACLDSIVIEALLPVVLTLEHVEKDDLLNSSTGISVQSRVSNQGQVYNAMRLRFTNGIVIGGTVKGQLSGGQVDMNSPNFFTKVTTSKRKNELYIGDYRCRWGWGYGLWQGTYIRGITGVNSLRKSGGGLAVYTGSDSLQHQRGIGFQHNENRWSTACWAGYANKIRLGGTSFHALGKKGEWGGAFQWEGQQITAHQWGYYQLLNHQFFMENQLSKYSKQMACGWVAVISSRCQLGYSTLFSWTSIPAFPLNTWVLDWSPYSKIKINAVFQHQTTAKTEEMTFFQHQESTRFQLNYKPTKKLVLYYRYSASWKVDTLPPIHHRIDLQWLRDTRQSWHVRFEYANTSNQMGWFWRLQWNQKMGMNQAIHVEIQTFDIPDWNYRIYASESNVPGVLYIPPHNSSGNRYIMVYKLNLPRNLTLYIKLAQWVYYLKNNPSPEWTFQFRWNIQ